MTDIATAPSAVTAWLGETGLDRDALIAAMQVDKKNRQGALRFSLLRSAGVTAEPWSTPADADVIRGVL